MGEFQKQYTKQKKLPTKNYTYDFIYNVLKIKNLIFNDKSRPVVNWGWG